MLENRGHLRRNRCVLGAQIHVGLSTLFSFAIAAATMATPFEDAETIVVGD